MKKILFIFGLVLFFSGCGEQRYFFQLKAFKHSTNSVGDYVAIHKSSTYENPINVIKQMDSYDDYFSNPKNRAIAVYNGNGYIYLGISQARETTEKANKVALQLCRNISNRNCKLFYSNNTEFGLK